jgi:hypothetical protein
MQDKVVPIFQGIFHKANPMFKLCSELQGAGAPQGRDRPSLSGNTPDLATSIAFAVKKAPAKRTSPRLFTPYEMAARLVASTQGFPFQNHVIYNLSMTLKKGGQGV